MAPTSMADSDLERELAQHASALRSMARALVGRSDADDLVQDTALRALRTPPPRTGGLGGFFATILRRLASRHRRGSVRREQRERSTARHETVPGVAIQLARHETVERLTRALLALPEPCRDTLLQRFFEDRKPAAIAQRSGVPVETVKTRIKRGLTLLRARLATDGSDSDWRAALAGAFGLGQPAGLAAFTTGVLHMTTGAKLATAGAAAVAAILAALLWLPAEPPAPANESASEVRGTTPVVSPELAQEPTAALQPEERSAVASPLPPAATAQAVVRGRCIDEDGAPVSGCPVAVRGFVDESRRGVSTDEWHDPPAQTSGPDGRWEQRFAPLPWWCGIQLTVGDADCLGGYGWWGQRDFPESRVIDLGDVPVFAALRTRIHVVDTGGAPVAKTSVQVSWVVPEGLKSPLEIPNLGNVKTTDADGCCTFALAAGSHRWSVHDRDVVNGGACTLARGQVGLTHEIVVAPAVTAAAISGVVVDQDGKPLMNIHPKGNASESRPPLVATSDSQGRFRIQRPAGMADGSVALSVDEDGYEPLAIEERIPWGSTDVRLVLSRGTAIEVLAITGQGMPVEDYRVWVVPRQDVSRGSMWNTRLRGKGRHPGGLARVTVPRGPYSVIVQPDDQALAFGGPEPIDVGTEPLRAAVTLHPAPRRLLRVLQGNGMPVPDAQVRVVDPGGVAKCAPDMAATLHEWAFHTKNGNRIDSRQPLHVLLQEARTDARGELLLRGWHPEPVTVEVSAVGHCRVQFDDVQLDVAEALVMTMRAGARLSGNAEPQILQDLRLIAGLPATGPVHRRQHDSQPRLFLSRDQGHLERHPGRGQTVPFDDEGNYAFANVPPGRWHLVLIACWADGRSWFHDVATVDLRDGEATEQPLDLTALAAGELTGRVLWNDRPLDSRTLGQEQLQVRVVRPQAGGQREQWTALTTDAEGSYRWRGPAGTVILHKGKDLCAPQSVVVRPGQQAVQDFHGASSVLRLRLVNSVGTPVASVNVDLFDLDGKPCASLPPTAADGRSQRELMAGTYRVETRPKPMPGRAGDALGQQGADARVYIGDVTVASGHTGEVTLRLPPQ